MLALLKDYIASQTRGVTRRAGFWAAFAGATAVLVVIAIAALVSAIFYWLEERLGPIEAELVIAAGALVLAVIASAPLWWPKRAPPPPPPQPTLAQFAALALKHGGGRLTLRQLAFGAVLGVAALGLITAPRRKDSEP